MSGPSFPEQVSASYEALLAREAALCRTAEQQAPVAPLDVSAFTGDDGMVHFIIQCGDRVTEVSGKATAVLEELFDNPVQVFSALGFDTFRQPKSRLQFTLQIEDATALTRGVPVRVANLEEDDA